jgi:hypothetical protein
MGLRWGVLSEFWGQHVYLRSPLFISAISYLVNWLDIPAVAISITTTSAFPHRCNLHHGWTAVARLWCGSG